MIVTGFPDESGGLNFDTVLGVPGGGFDTKLEGVR